MRVVKEISFRYFIVGHFSSGYSAGVDQGEKFLVELSGEVEFLDLFFFEYFDDGDEEKFVFVVEFGSFFFVEFFGFLEELFFGGESQSDL